jgi:hypothetical protein
MLAAVLRRTMVASGTTAVALMASVLPADAATTGWRIVSPVPAPTGGHGVLFAVHADAPGDAWGVGAYNPRAARVLIDRWNGTSWAQVALPSSVRSALGRQQLFVTVGSSSAANVWSFGLCASGMLGGACWLHRSGSAWTGGRLVGRQFSNVIIEHVLVLRRRNVWAFGSKTAPSGPRAFAMHNDGAGWRIEAAPGKAGVVDASAVRSSDIWAVEGASLFSVSLFSVGSPKGALIHWSAGRWHSLALPTALRGRALDSVQAFSDANVWVGSATRNSRRGTTEAVGHWNGRAWSVTTMKVPASRAKYAMIALVPDGHGGLWAAGGDLRADRATRLWHFSSGRWVRASVAGSRTPPILAGLASVPGTRSVWGVGATVTNQTPTGVIALDGPVPH